MSWLQGVGTRLKLIFARQSAEARFDREFQFHIDMEAERLVRDEGFQPDEARRRALASFGGVQLHREALRDGRNTGWFNSLSLDLKLGFRMLAKYPGLTIVGVVGMSVAVTVGALAFTAVRTVTSNKLPMPEGDRVVSITNIDARFNDDASATHLHDLGTWREGLRAVSELSGYRILSANMVIGSAAPVSMRVAAMSASGFRLTRVQPVLGRYLMDEDEREGAPDVVVVGHDLWQNRLGGRSNAIGSTVRLGTTIYTVVGVMPRGFAFPVNNAVWVPLRLNPLRYPRGNAPGIAVFGRLTPGASLEDARLQVSTIGQRLTTEFPTTHEHIRPRVTYFANLLGDSPGLSGLLYLGTVVVSLFLVVIGVNVAVLVYARTASRTSEIAVRTALGASRRRIVMQLFGEALALSSVASVVGIFIANIVFQRVEAMVRLSAEGEMPYWLELRLTPSVMIYVVGMTILAAIIIGVIPGLKATRHNLAANIKDASGGTSIRLGRSWTGLLVSQVAISVCALPIALAGTEGLIRMGLRDFSTPATESFVIATPNLSVEGNSSDSAARDARNARYTARVQQLAEALRELPGGGATVVFMSHAPSGEDQVPIRVARIEGDSAADSLTAGRYTAISSVDAQFFGAFDIRLLAGRAFRAEDLAAGAANVVVNRSFVQHFFAGGNALGRVIYQEPGAGETTPPVRLEIIGVVDDFPPLWDPEGLEPKIYRALQPGTYPVTMAVRAPGLATPALPDRIRQVAMSVDPDLRFVAIPTARALIEQEADGERMLMLGVVMVGLSVVLLSTAGIYALMSFTVSRRQREIGIRSALGASRSRVLSGVLSRAMTQVGIGIAIGVTGAAALSRLLGDTHSASETLVLVIKVALLMGFVGALATVGPARRALRVQPTDALKAE